MKPPVPINSLKKAIIKQAKAKPIETPRASNIESTTECLLAKASALPKIIQLTVIRGMKTPKDSDKEGV